MYKFFLVILLGLMNNSVLAQSNNDLNIRIGIKAGANFSHMNFSKGSPPPEVAINTNWQPGITAGFLVAVPFSKNFGFQPEYLISQMGGKIEAENRQYVVYYVSLPVLLYWQFDNKFSLLAGPQFDLLINGKDKTGHNFTSLEREIEQRSILITGGLEYCITDHLVSAIRYLHGFNNISISRDTGYEEFKYSVVQLSLSYLF